MSESVRIKQEVPVGKLSDSWNDNILQFCDPDFSMKIESYSKKTDFGFCDSCGINVYSMKAHVAAFHEDKKEERCVICGQLFFKKSKLVRHLLKHENNVIRCHVCHIEGFDDFESLFDHLEEHPLLHIYYCHICRESFALKSKLDDHLTAHSSSLKLPFLECFQCQMRFDPNKGGIRSMKKHWLVSHSKHFKCDICSKDFEKFIVFFNHRLRHSKLLPYSCEECGASFRKECRLKEHFHAVHLNKYSYKCSQCDLDFKYKSSYDAHLRLHDDSLCFQCNYCSKLFLRKVSLLYHFVDKSCNLCAEVFHCRTMFDSHFQSKHLTDRLFECDCCSKSYVLENALKRHKTLMHPVKGENIFKCNLCLYETSTKHNLNRHRRRNHIDKQVKKSKR